MKNTEKLSLIEGVFSAEETKEILMNMFSSKINFHNIRNWSSRERFGKDDEISRKRIPQLQNEMQKLQEILSDAKNQNKKLLINSEVNISFSNE